MYRMQSVYLSPRNAPYSYHCMNGGFSIMRKTMASLLFCTALTLTAITASGCNYKELVQKSDFDYGSRKIGDPKTAGIQSYGSRSKDPDKHNNAFFEYSSLLSRKVTDLNGVGSAIVMLTDKNAYAAILLDWTSVGTLGSGGKMEQDNTGTNEAVFNRMNGSPYGNNIALAYPYNSLFTVNDYNNLSHELKQTVAAKIREFAPNVQEVHISANMDFNNQFNELAKEAWGGRPLAPWIDKFNIVVQHQFAGGKIMPSPIVDPQSIPAR